MVYDLEVNWEREREWEEERTKWGFASRGKQEKE